MSLRPNAISYLARIYPPKKAPWAQEGPLVRTNGPPCVEALRGDQRLSRFIDKMLITDYFHGVQFGCLLAT